MDWDVINVLEGFFDEIEDNQKYEKISIYLIGVPLGVVLLWIYNTFVNIDPQIAIYSYIYTVMLIVWGIGLTADLLWANMGKEDQMSANGLGKKPLKGIWVGVIGFFVFIIISSIFFRAGAIVPFSFVGENILLFFFVVIIAPIVEANMFRGLFQPMLVNGIESFLVKSRPVAWVIACVVQSFAFAFFHVNVIGGIFGFEFFSLLPFFVFGVIATIVVYAGRSISGEYVMHGLNNCFAWFL